MDGGCELVVQPAESGTGIAYRHRSNVGHYHPQGLRDRGMYDCRLHPALHLVGGDLGGRGDLGVLPDTREAGSETVKELTDIHYLILYAALGLLGKVVWDWLANRRANGRETEMSSVLKDMQDRQKKMWEFMLEHLGKRKQE
jgi:hypothetical protein